MSGWGGLSASEMAVIDENSEWLGISRSILMENAGAWVARIAYQWLGGLSGKRVVIFSGTGNNGGDGFVAARHAANLGAKVMTVLIGDPKNIRTDESRRNFEIIRSMRESIRLYIVKDVDDVRLIREDAEKADVVIDAIFGTGIRGKIREPWRTVIQLINSLKALKISVDIPSGVNPNTGEIEDVAVEANVTVTFHRPKLGMPAAVDYCGEVIVAPIGIPPEAEIIMGPGDARLSFRSMKDSSREVILLDEVGSEAKEIFSLFNVRYRFNGDPSGKVVFIGDQWNLIDQCENASAVIAFGLKVLKPNLIAIVDREDASNVLDIDLRAPLLEKHDLLVKKSAQLSSLIYVLGEDADILLGDSRWKLSWVNRPLNSLGTSTLLASSLSLLSKEVDRFTALSASGYLAGYATKFGYEALLEEMKRLQG